MNKLPFIILFLFPVCVLAQNKFTVSGYIEDAANKERLIGANVIANNRNGIASNNFGFYSITLEAGNCTLRASFIGFKNNIKKINLKSDTTINFALEKGLLIDEIEIKGNKESQSNPELSSMSFYSPNMNEINKIPVVFAEQDILKTIQFLPGIKSARENGAGFNVRGGSPDQNLILLDGVPVYNVNHLFGFFSTFNSDAIKNVSLYKGGIPARYGGRLSSVLDISMKEGSMKKAHGVFSISPISARMTYEAPIKKDTASFIISLRRTMLDIPMVLYQTLAGQDNKYGYYFYDFNAKTNWIINPKNRLYLSIYSGKDNQFNNGDSEGIKSRFRYNWGNITSVLRWNHQISPKMFSNVSAYYSHYELKNLGSSDDGENKVLFQANSDIQDFCIKSDFDWYISSENTIRFGVKSSKKIFAPNIIQMRDKENDVTLNENQKNNSLNFEGFIENNFQYKNLNLNLGFRGVLFNTGEKTYKYIEPRTAIKYNISDNFSTNLSYTKMSQFIHLLSNSSLGMPADLWVASTDDVKPQKSQQVSLGFEKQYMNFSFGIESYYKWMKDVIRFEEGAVFLNTQDTEWPENISVGEGKAYGVEAIAKKEKGDLTGYASYTLAWSKRKFDDVIPNLWFPHKHDRRHDISILGKYNIFQNEHREKSFSFGFTLQSGNKISMPDMEYEGIFLPGANESTKGVPEWQKAKQSYIFPNNFAMPLFHHLDLGYTSSRFLKSGKSLTWSYSVYNVYSRMNPWYYYKNRQGQLKQVSIFPIIPSVGFKYTF